MKLIAQTPMILVIDGIVKLPVSEMRNEELKSLFHFGTDHPVPDQSWYFLYSDRDPALSAAAQLMLDFTEAKKRWLISFIRCHAVGHSWESRVRFLRELDLA